ncbi:MAG: hypothetical protein ABII18_07005 [bacterium]
MKMRINYKSITIFMSVFLLLVLLAPSIHSKAKNSNDMHFDLKSIVNKLEGLVKKSDDSNRTKILSAQSACKPGYMQHGSYEGLVTECCEYDADGDCTEITVCKVTIATCSNLGDHNDQYTGVSDPYDCDACSSSSSGVTEPEEFETISP